MIINTKYTYMYILQYIYIINTNVDYFDRLKKLFISQNVEIKICILIKA